MRLGQQLSNICAKFCAYDSMLLTNVSIGPAWGWEATCFMATWYSFTAHERFV